MAETNITKTHEEAFEALRDSQFNNFALFSCYMNGEPTAAIVSIEPLEGGAVIITPLFVAVTASMKLVDHDGKEA